jgi:hypothetical protein
MARAVRAGSHYTALKPELVGPLGTLLARLSHDAGPDSCVFLGFDFPIGVPAAYARQAGVLDFPSVLPVLGQGTWARFFDLAERPGDIALGRPFYPLRPGGTSQQHLLSGLGVPSMNDLRRLCERRTPTRGDACVLFWTLGGNQVGRAAIIGWADVLAPAVRAMTLPPSLWPFHGTLADLLAPGRVVVAETYPAEFYGHFGVSFPASRPGRRSGKRVQADRRANAPALLARAAQLGVAVDAALQAAILDGFGPSPDGEDPFDAVVGLVGMLNVLLGGRASGEPATADVRNIEGWIFGQAFSSASA